MLNENSFIIDLDYEHTTSDSVFKDECYEFIENNLEKIKEIMSKI